MKVRLTPVAAAILAMYALPSHAQDAVPAAEVAPPAEQAQQLPAVKVEDSAINAYKADAVASPKFTQPLLNTPQTISVVKKEVIAEQGAMSLSDVLRNTPGITFQAGENGNSTSGDAIFMRGFDTQGNIFLDGIRDLGPGVRDVFNLEQIEIFKGPTGADNGRGAASGYINLVSKTPFADDAISGSLSYGDEDRRRLTADLNQKLGDDSALRLNVMAQDGGVAGRDFIERRQWGVAPSVAFGLGTATRVTLFSQHVRQDNTPDGGVSAIGISGYRNAVLAGGNTTNTVVDARPVDRENFYGLNADFENIKGDMVTARIEHDLTSNVTVRNLSRYGKISQERVLTAPLQAAVVSDGTPAELRTDPDTWTQGRSRQGSYRDNDILTNQTNFTATVRTGVVEHALSGGVEFIYESQFTPSYALAAGQTQTPANLYNPNRNDAAADVVRSGASADGETTTGAIYLFDTLKFGERWQLNGGLRWERYETDTTNVAAAAAPAPQGTPGVVTLEHDADNLLSWKVGALFKPLPNGSVYVAYSTSFRPPGGDNFTLSSTAANINNAALDPQKARNLELGTKWDFLDGRLATTLALFQSENKNDLARADPGDPDSVIQYGKREVEGVEVGVVGQLTDAWQLIFGYTFQDTEVEEGSIPSSGGPSTQTGAAINFSPKHSATLWTTYKLPMALTLGGGLRYVDSQARTINADLASVTTGIVEVESYAVIDAMAAYDFTSNVGVQFNAYNLADEEYVASVNNSGQRYFPGTPRSYLLTLNLKF